MQYVVWHCHVGKCKVFPERDDVWMGAYVVLELGYTFQHWWWIVFTDNVFWKYSWAHVVISITVAFLYVMQCRLRAWRSRASSMVFRPWPLCTEIVPDSLNLWMILCTVDDDNFKLFAIFLWETPFWYCSTIFRRSIGGIGDPLPILTSERHCHSERLFFIPNHVANWPNKLQICPPAVPYMYI